MSSMLDSLPLISRGKGKDLRGIPGRPDLALMVFRDSLSTHNVTHLTEIPGKGEIILAQTLFMALNCLNGLPTHIVGFGRQIYEMLPGGPYPEDLHRRALIVRLLPQPQVEFVFRRHLAGSLLKALQKSGMDPYGIGLPGDLKLMHRFPEFLLTPTEKSESDDPLKASDVERNLPKDTEVARTAFSLAEAYLEQRELVLVDAKFELSDGIIADDWLNGDCARIVRARDIRVGEEPAFLDKEVFRQIAVRKWDGGKRLPLTFTEAEFSEGLAGYHEGFVAVTNLTLDDFREAYLEF
ncbi:MAG TPA: phosphoribosylaminoimidazolesuccinocarboxamide synthase [Candidatus Paceibacterota bacterium]